MIQRLQSILLLLAAAANFACLWLPYGYAEDNAENEAPRAYMSATSFSYEILVTSENEALFEGKDVKWGNYYKETIGPGDNLMILIHTILLVTNGFVIILLIFLYGNRIRQAQLVLATIAGIMVQITVSAILLYSTLPGLVGIGDGGGENRFEMGPQYGFLVPVITIALLWWASKRIKADERKVRDADRIR